MVHVQMISPESDDMVREAKKYRSYFDFGDNFYAQIPVTEKGYRVKRISTSSDQFYPVC